MLVLGGLELLFVLGFVVVPLVLGIWAAVDASKYPDWAFERAGTSKTLWIVLPIVGMLACGIVAIVAAIVWFSSTKQKVQASAGGYLPPPPAPPAPPVS